LGAILGAQITQTIQIAEKGELGGFGGTEKSIKNAAHPKKRGTNEQKFTKIDQKCACFDQKLTKMRTF